MSDVEAQAPVKVTVDLRPALYADALSSAVRRAGACVVNDGPADVRIVSDQVQEAGPGDLAVVMVPSDGRGPIIVAYADGTVLRLGSLAAFERWLRAVERPG